MRFVGQNGYFVTLLGRSQAPEAGLRVTLNRMYRRHPPFPAWRAAVVAMCLLTASATVSAQWLWIDGAGNKVFSDTAPPPGTPDKNILRKPGARPEVKSPEAPAASASPTTQAPMPKVQGKDDQLEAKKKLAEKEAQEAEKAKQQAQAEQLAKTRAGNCERARQSKATLDSGMRIATVNAKGEREILDDKGRAAEARRVDEIIRSNCGPLPQAQSQGGAVAN